MATLIDTHVHLHDCFSLSPFLNAATKNFQRAVRKHSDLAGDQPVDNNAHVLLLCQMQAGDPLMKFVNAANSQDLGGWSISMVDEIAVNCSHRHLPPLLVVAGRQIVTSERLELLSLCSTNTVQNGEPLASSIAKVWAGDGVPVIPWGFGKWWFKRGVLLREYLREVASNRVETDPSSVLLGDNGCRWNRLRPEMLRFAEALGFGVLCGSDPLTLSDHVQRVGSFGNYFQQTIDLGAPVDAIRKLLVKTAGSPSTFGECRTLPDMLRDQIQLRRGGVR